MTEKNTKLISQTADWSEMYEGEKIGIIGIVRTFGFTYRLIQIAFEKEN